MEEKKEHNCIFDEKKKTARILRYVYIAAAVVYVGLLIWSLCRQNYVAALFDVALLLMDIGYVFWCNSSISDADLAISAIEHEHSRCNIIKDIYRNHTWISVKDRLPDEDLFNRGYSEEVVGLFMDGNIRISHCYCSIDEGIWFFKGLTCDPPTHWTPIKKTP